MGDIYLFVYGTLKRGVHNHYLLDEVEFICEATTKQKYPMVNTEEYFPSLIDDVGNGYNVEGEVYKISKQILSVLEILEGYPDHYYHRNIQVLLV